jgi:hypothetical protein
MMIVIATLAVSWSMCFGIGHLTLFLANFHAVEHCTQEAILWEAEHNAEKVQDRRRMAERYARLHAQSLAYISTALSLIAVGVASGGLGTAAKALYRRRNEAQPQWVGALANTCRTVGGIVLVGLAVGFIAYVALMLFVRVTSE